MLHLGKNVAKMSSQLTDQKLPGKKQVVVASV